MRIPRTKKTIAAAAIGTVALLGGGLSVANAATGSGAGDSPAITGTVPAPAETTPEGADTPASEQAQADQLTKLATVTPEAAKAAAEKAAGGTATDVQLGDENGFVVYEVTVNASSGQVEVKVDAGSGTVLAQENDNEGAEGSEGAGEQADGQEGPETADGPNDTETSDGPDAPGSSDGQTGGGTTGGSTTAPTTPAP